MLSTHRPATGRAQRHRAWRLVIALVVVDALSALTTVAKLAARESDIKATLLYNFCYFVEWPAPVLSDTNAPLVIGVLGSDPFGKFLDELVRNEQAYHKRIVVRHFRNAKQARSAQILYVSRSERRRFGSILSATSRRPILTVGDGPGDGFIEHGGMVEMIVREDKVHLRINLRAVRAAGLTISSKVLSLADIVHI